MNKTMGTSSRLPPPEHAGRVAVRGEAYQAVRGAAMSAQVRRAGRAVVAGVLGVLALGSVVQAAAPKRIVSINLCTDQLLLAFADRSQILALSQFAGDGRLAYYRAEAKGLRQTGGSAEEVLKLKPDLVLTDSFSGRATREILGRFGVRVETFRPVQSIEDARTAMLRAARLVGHEDRGVAMVGRLDTALATLKAGERKLSALQLQRRGFASGAGTLIDDLMGRAGLQNAATRLGISSVGPTTLETVLKTSPDVLILDAERIEAIDQGASLLMHPALARLVPEARRIVLPARTTVCGGPAIVEAIAALAAGLARVRETQSAK